MSVLRRDVRFVSFRGDGGRFVRNDSRRARNNRQPTHRPNPKFVKVQCFVFVVQRSSDYHVSMKFYLHIGTNKTGTSSIQRSLSDSTELLAENGICYPDTGRDDEYRVAHHPFAELGRNFPRQMAEQVASMVEEAESRGLDSIILSSEAFHTVHAHIVGQALKGHDVEVFAF